MRPVVLLPFLMAVAVANCSNPSAPSSLSVTASLDRTRVRVGDVVNVATEARNTGQAALRVTGGPVAFLEIRNAANRVVFFGRSGAFAAIAYPPRILEPGDQVSDEPFWRIEVVGGTSAQAPPGVYRVRAAVLPLGGKKAHYVFSAPMELTVEQ